MSSHEEQWRRFVALSSLIGKIKVDLETMRRNGELQGRIRIKEMLLESLVREQKLLESVVNDG